MLKLKLQYFGHLMRRADSFEKTLMLGKIEDRQKEKGMTEDEMVGWHHQLDGHEFEWAPRVGWWTGRPGMVQSMGLQRVVHDWATELNRYADNTILMAESEEELKSVLMKVKEESEKAGLKFNLQKMKIMAFGPITSWQTDGGKWKQWQTLFSWAPKSMQMVTVAMKWKDACSFKEKLWPT